MKAGSIEAAAGPMARLDRRQFLTGVSVAAWLAASHAAGLRAAAPESGSVFPRGGGEPAAATGPAGIGRIRRLGLRTAAPLAEMRAFYRDLLGLVVVAEDSRRLTIQAGETPITFTAAEAGDRGAPFYHFAFNIPENKLRAARDWQRDRSAIIPPSPGLRDAAYPDDVTHFRNWNAHSVFFWDPAGNLLEYIARHDLANAAPGPFDSADILYASEIGLVVDDVPAVAGGLRETFALPRYRSGSDQFTPLGDELGLLLVMKRGRNLGFGEGRPAGVFATEVDLRGARPGRYSPPGYPFAVAAG